MDKVKETIKNLKPHEKKNLEEQEVSIQPIDAHNPEAAAVPENKFAAHNVKGGPARPPADAKIEEHNTRQERDELAKDWNPKGEKTD